MAVRVDVAVVGAGAFGLSVALHWSRIGPFKPSRFGAISDEYLISKGAWEYAHFYDPAP